jgi:hypothetical protein
VTSIVPNRLKTKLTNYWYARLARDFPVYFIISTGRTGTKFFETFLGDVTDQVYCLHEPSPDLFDLGVGLYRGEIAEARVVKELLKSRIPMLRETRALGKRVYVESNPNASLLLPQIRQVFPNYRVVWLTRDIKTYLPSAYNKSPDDSGTMFFYANDDHRKRLSAEDITSDPWRSEWPRLSRAERIAWWWQKCNSLLLEQTGNDPRCLHLKFESIFNSATGPAEMAKMLKFFGIENQASKCTEATLKALGDPKNQTRHSAGTPLDDSANSSASRVDEITGGLRARLGYGPA